MGESGFFALVFMFAMDFFAPSYIIALVAARLLSTKTKGSSQKEGETPVVAVEEELLDDDDDMEEEEDDDDDMEEELLLHDYDIDEELLDDDDHMPEIGSCAMDWEEQHGREDDIMEKLTTASAYDTASLWLLKNRGPRKGRDVSVATSKKTT